MLIWDPLDLEGLLGFDACNLGRCLLLWSDPPRQEASEAEVLAAALQPEQIPQLDIERSFEMWFAIYTPRGATHLLIKEKTLNDVGMPDKWFKVYSLVRSVSYVIYAIYHVSCVYYVSHLLSLSFNAIYHTCVLFRISYQRSVLLNQACAGSLRLLLEIGRLPLRGGIYHSFEVRGPSFGPFKGVYGS